MWECSKCGEQIEDNFDSCWNCGIGKDGSQPLESQEFVKIKKENMLSRAIIKDKSKQKEQSRYPALQSISATFLILAWIVAILAVIGFIFSLFNLRGNEAVLGVPLLIGSLVGGAIIFITLLAASELIELFIDIEKNTRFASLNINKKDK